MAVSITSFSTLNFGGFIRPEAEEADRFFTPWSSAATADFVAMMAMAARIYRPFDPAFADKCLTAANRSYTFLREHPDDHRADLTGFRTGALKPVMRTIVCGQPQRCGRRLERRIAWKDFEQRAHSSRPKSPPIGIGVMLLISAYSRTCSPSDQVGTQLLDLIRNDLIHDADEIVRTAQGHGYARPLGTTYYSGANGTIVAPDHEPDDRQSCGAEGRVSGHVARRASPARAECLRAIVCHRIGHKPPMNPHSRRSGSDDVANPWPGYLVGGGHPRAVDWLDEEESYSTNEIAINWNGALIYACAAFVHAPR